MKKTILLLFILFSSSKSLSQVFPESFEGNFPPDGPGGSWVVTHNGIGMGPTNRNVWKQTPEQSDLYSPHTGNHAAMVEKINVGNGKTEEDWLISPRVTIPAKGQLCFYALHGRSGDQGSKLKIKISKTSQTDRSTFTTELAEFSETQIGLTPNIYKKLTVNFEGIVPAGQSIYIAFVRVHHQTTDTPGDRFLIDDITMASPCEKPADVVINDVTATTARLNWKPNPNAAIKWEMELVPFTAVPSGNGIILSESTFMAHDLTPETSYKFRVRSQCAANEYSDWSDFYVFKTKSAKSDCEKAHPLTVNKENTCEITIPVSFSEAETASVSSTCAGVSAGDVWFSFRATQDIHIVDLLRFKGKMRPVSITLYEGDRCEKLHELYCSSNNSVSALGLQIDKDYLIRLSIDDNNEVQHFSFEICIKTPIRSETHESECMVNTVNPDFEKPEIDSEKDSSQIFSYSVPGWKTTKAGGNIKLWKSVTQAYSGKQFLELNESEVPDVYQDYATPVSISLTYHFAHKARDNESFCSLYAGPPDGPYVFVAKTTTGNEEWKPYTGNYTAPDDQPVTRFIFKNESGSGNFLDQFRLTGNIGVASQNPVNLSCSDTKAEVSAIGVGVWMADANNPAPTHIGDPHLNKTVISGFTVNGAYQYFWKTQYCKSEPLVIYFHRDRSTIVPTFNTIKPICVGASVPKLPTRSKEGIIGTWFPLEVNNEHTTTYTFTPLEGQCVKERATASLVIPVIASCEIFSDCVENQVVLKVKPANDTTFDLESTHFQWYTDKDEKIGENKPDFNVTKYYLSSGIKTDFPAIYKVKVIASAGCILEKEFTVDRIHCQIQKGISPNNDGLNDSFDLTGFNVEKLSIFNRYGSEVYSYGAGYTKQWLGQSNGGSELPDGTYFYVIALKGGDTKTGWVYISREK